MMVFWVATLRAVFNWRLKELPKNNRLFHRIQMRRRTWGRGGKGWVGERREVRIWCCLAVSVRLWIGRLVLSLATYPVLILARLVRRMTRRCSWRRSLRSGLQVRLKMRLLHFMTKWGQYTISNPMKTSRLSIKGHLMALKRLLRSQMMKAVMAILSESGREKLKHRSWIRLRSSPLLIRYQIVCDQNLRLADGKQTIGFIREETSSQRTSQKRWRLKMPLTFAQSCIPFFYCSDLWPLSLGSAWISTCCTTCPDPLSNSSCLLY